MTLDLMDLTYTRAATDEGNLVGKLFQSCHYPVLG